jgi:hypothetical protein
VLLAYGWRAFPVFRADAQAGGYRLEVTVKGKAYTASDTLSDAAFKLLSPTTVTATGNQTTVNASWTAVTGAASYSLGIFRGNYEQPIGSYVATKATSYSFTNLNLAPGTYLVEVTPSNLDFTGVPTKQRPYGVSFGSAAFTVGN